MDIELLFINSRQNPLIKHVSSLLHKKYRTQHGQFIAHGIRSCSTLLASSIKPLGLFFTSDMQEQITNLAPRCPLYCVSPSVMEKINPHATAHGVVGQYAIPKTAVPLGSRGLVCAHLADPGNLGTLIRSAAAFGITSVICVETVDPWSPKVIHASAGTIGMVTIHEWHWKQVVSTTSTHTLCALVVAGGKGPDTVPQDNWLLIVGSEAHGIPQEWVNDCSTTITIPMAHTTESLNAAVAGSIALYVLRAPHMV